MNAIRMTIFFLFCLFITPKVLLGQEVIYQKGKVEISENSNGPYRPLEGNKISYDSYVQTGEDGLVVFSFPEGSKLKIDPGSKIQIGERESHTNSGTSEASTWNLRALKGALTVDFKKANENEDLFVESDSFAVGVIGTTFLVGKEENEDWHVAVNKGKVAVFNKGTYDYEDVSANESILVEKGKELTKPEGNNWQKSLNWVIAKGAISSGFRKKQVSELRRSEIKKKIKQLRQRRKKVLQGRLKENLQRFKKRKELRKLKRKEQGNKNPKKRTQRQVERKKKSAKRNSVKKNTPQKFREKMRKRGAIRRRR